MADDAVRLRMGGRSSSWAAVGVLGDGQEPVAHGARDRQVRKFPEVELDDVRGEVWSVSVLCSQSTSLCWLKAATTGTGNDEPTRKILSVSRGFSRRRNSTDP